MPTVTTAANITAIHRSSPPHVALALLTRLPNSPTISFGIGASFTDVEEDTLLEAFVGVGVGVGIAVEYGSVGLAVPFNVTTVTIVSVSTTAGRASGTSRARRKTKRNVFRASIAMVWVSVAVLE